MGQAETVYAAQDSGAYWLCGGDTAMKDRVKCSKVVSKYGGRAEAF